MVFAGNKNTQVQVKHDLPPPPSGMSETTSRHHRALSRQMMGAIAKIKAQYKNAVYLGEQPVAIQKIPSRPSTKKSHQHKRTIRAQHNNLIPRQFIEEERIVPVLHMKKSLLPTSELPLNAIDDNIATQTKEDWENKSIKPPRNSPAKRLYNKNNKRNQHGNATSSANDLPMSLFVATTDAPHSGIRVQAPPQEPQELVSNNTNNTQETIQTLEPPRIPTAAVPVQPRQTQSLHPVEETTQQTSPQQVRLHRTVSPFHLGNTSTTPTALTRSSIDKKTKGRTVESRGGSTLWVVDDEDDVVRDGRVVAMVPAKASSSPMGVSLTLTSKKTRTMHIVGMIVFD